MFFGREKKLTDLLDACAAAGPGEPVCALIHGVSGIGKTALLQQVGHWLESGQQPGVVLRGRFREWCPKPFSAFNEIVGDLIRQLQVLSTEALEGLLPRHSELLCRMFPTLDGVELLAPKGRRLSPFDNAQDLQALAFDALRELLDRLPGDTGAARRRVVLLIDDLQWADDDSLTLLRRLLQPPGAPEVSVLATLRTPPGARAASQALSEAAAGFPFTPLSVDVGTLSAIDAGALANALLRDAAGEDDEATDPRAEPIARASGGHPLLVVELVQHGLLGELPEGKLRLDEAFWTRISALEPRQRGLVELVCVAGRPLPRRITAAASGLEAAELTSAVVELWKAHLISSSGPGEDDLLEPYHDQVRAAVLSSLTHEATQRLHAALAGALQDDPGGAMPGALALHHQGAGDLASAARAAARAADDAAKALAFHRAAGLYHLAVDQWEGDAEEQRDLRVRLGEALANAGRGLEAANAFEQAALSARPAATLDLQRRAAEQLLRCGHVDQGMESMAQVFSALGVRFPGTSLGALSALLLRRLQIRLRGVRFKERDEAQISPEALARADLCRSVGVGLGLIDHIRGAVFSTRFVLDALNTGEPGRVLIALALEADHVAASGGAGSSYQRKLIVAAEALHARRRDVRGGAYLEAARAIGQFGAGAWSSAREHADAAQAMMVGQQGLDYERAVMRFIAVWSLFYSGELREMTRRVLPWLQEANDRGDLFAASGMVLGLANVVHLEQAGLDQTLEMTKAILRRWSMKGYHFQHYMALLGRTQIDLCGSYGKLAYSRVEADWPRLEGALLHHLTGVRHEGEHLRARAALAAALEQGPESRERDHLLASAEKSCRRLDRFGLAWTTALAELVRAGAAAQRGGTEEAITRLRRAMSALDAEQMQLYAAATRRRLGALIGGDEGQALTTEGTGFMETQGLVNPARTTAMLAPGFPQGD